MTELDFDELDKAVSNLMGGGAAAQNDDHTTAVPPSTVTSATEQTSPVRSVSTSASRPPAARRTGRFMDVIHPASTMKPAAVSPISSKEKDEIPTPESQREKSVPDSSVSVEPSKTTTDTTATSIASSTNEWPDPVDLVPAGGALSSSVSVPAGTSQQDEPEEKEPESAYSPFLSDAKVEKRPLGSPISFANVDDATTSEDESAQLPAETKDIEPALPDELHSDLLAIEAGAVQHSEDESKERMQTPRELKKVEEPPTPQSVSKSDYTGLASIPQQYKEEPVAIKPESGSIYDTDTYHQPLAHPAKKKSGWLVVVWILLILIVGAGAGAAFYLFWQ